eukprot:UC1_evm2s1183
MSDSADTTAPKEGCCARSNRNCKSCLNSRTGFEWRRLIGAYVLFYMFLLAPPQCTFRNGNFCIGEPRILERIRGRVSQNHTQVTKTWFCASNSTDCYATTTVRLNSIWDFRQLETGIEITCSLNSKPELTFIESYQLEDSFPPLATTNVSAHCLNNSGVPSSLAAFLGPHGNTEGRTCAANGTSVTFTYAKGAYAPFYQDMVTSIPTASLPTSPLATTGDTTSLRYLQYTCTAAATGNGTLPSVFDTQNRWPSNVAYITMSFGRYVEGENQGNDVTTPELRNPDII